MACNTPVGLPPHCLLVARDGRETAVEDSATPIRDAAGTVTGAVIVFRDVGPTLTHARQLAHAALHDPLTGLPNRRLLLERLASALASGRERRRSVAVGFLDVDGFKQINDAGGHASGDRLLQAIGARLQAAVRHSDTVSRYGGDEFVVVLADVDDDRHLSSIAATLLDAGAGPHLLDGHHVTASLSLGLALAPRDGREAPTLIAHADTAMYASRAHRVTGSVR
jgi:diguanylate cyclase (GGDEF)-like protein